MPKNSEIMRAVKKGLDSLKSKVPIGAPTEKWTKVIKTELCEIGRDRFKCQVYAQDVPRDKTNGGEWLYDVTWLKYERNGDGELIEAPLVAECEWGGKPHIQDDFEKLLLARAGVRVMIVDAGTDPHYPKEIAELLAGKIKKFKDFRAKDAWLLAVVEQSDGGWRFKYFHGRSLQEWKP